MNMTRMVTLVEDRTSMAMSKTQSSMRSNPTKWVGVAAASGFVLGMLGRLMQWRREQRRHIPTLVVIETSC